MTESELHLWARNLAIKSKSDVTINQSAYEMRVLRKAVSEHGDIGVFPNILDGLENTLSLSNKDTRDQYQKYQKLLESRDIFEASFKAAEQSLVLARFRKDKHCFVETQQERRQDKSREWSFRKRNLGKQNDVYNCMNYFLEIAADAMKGLESKRHMNKHFQYLIAKAERESRDLQTCNKELRKDIGQVTRWLLEETPILREELLQIALTLIENDDQFSDIESKDLTDDEKLLLLDNIVATKDEGLISSFIQFVTDITEQTKVLIRRKKRVEKEACELNCEMMKGQIQLSKGKNKIRNAKHQLGSQQKDKNNVTKALKKQNSLHQTFSKENEFLEYRIQFGEERMGQIDEEMSSIDMEIIKLKEKCNYHKYARDLYITECKRLSKK